MPTTENHQITSLLASGTIKAITIDTSIFDEKKYQFQAAPLNSLTGLKVKNFPFILSATVAKEAQRHLEKMTEDAHRDAKKSIGQALFAFETDKPTRDELLDQISGGRSAAEAANERFGGFLKQTACEVLEDANLVDTASLFDAYFTGKPPFGAGKKKSEFPDALALKALENTTAARDIAIIVVSKDGDWKSFCETSDRLFLVPDIETALDLINDAPLKLRETLFSWISEGGAGHDEVVDAVKRHVERVDINVEAYATSGELEAFAWAGSLTEIEWPALEDMSIIDATLAGDGEWSQVVLSLPLEGTVTAQVEINFSFWDSIDRESVAMGGRTIEVEKPVEMRLTLTLDVFNPGKEDEDIEYNDSQIDLRSLDINLGSVDVFEPEDYDA
ncbi:PIN domain-containing protein [Rhizobium leguminosarum]|uniref:PIN domain-containing protein n=1 Tax=Rhizobium leguminosarum TaxID=384 RepID=UPI000486407B|nr:PIN domain-containing protein [Rhizobium leguminosarum]